MYQFSHSFIHSFSQVDVNDPGLYKDSLEVFSGEWLEAELINAGLESFIAILLIRVSREATDVRHRESGFRVSEREKVQHSAHLTNRLWPIQPMHRVIAQDKLEGWRGSAIFNFPADGCGRDLRKSLLKYL